MHRMLLNLAKVASHTTSVKVDKRKTFTMPILNYKSLKLSYDVFSRSYCCFCNLSYHEDDNTCPPMIGKGFDSLIVASTD